MYPAAIVLILEALFVYFLVLGTHALRRRYGLAHFYALLGGLTAIMSWVTDAGVKVELAGVTFMIGSTVFYTSLILGTFVIYVFDGPTKSRVAISTVLGVSILMPLVAAVLHWQASLVGVDHLPLVPVPSLRINAASAFTTFIDLLFLGIAWELLGKPRLRIGLWLRTYLTLLAVLMLDVLLFNTGAFLGDPNYLAIMSGTMISRFTISIFAVPFLYTYLRWQSSKPGVALVNRPILTILREFFEIEAELDRAQEEIRRRRRAELEREQAMFELEQSREQLRKLSEKFKRASRTDDLTGIANRRAFNEILHKEWKRAIRERTVLSVLLIDVDGFKAFNDQKGHVAGDRALMRLAAELKLQFRRPADLLARYGGDEFAAILPRTDSSGALTVAENCLRRIQALDNDGVWPSGHSLSISIGTASVAPEAGATSEKLLVQADEALYRAKRAGGANCVQAGDLNMSKDRATS